jgi:cytochrome c
MFTLNKRVLGRRGVAACALGLACAAAMNAAVAENGFGLGRAATPAEIQAWDIDVRPDFKGLPPGSGTVDQGSAIWDSTCAACHGTFAESNSVFTAIVGGTTEEDIKTGHVASLTSATQPVRTTFMKVDTISTLWDYIHRAMPWNKPKSLEPDDVYAVLAYLLNLAEIVPSDFTLSNGNIAQVQAKMPNRNGMVFWKGLWNVDGTPDTHNTACMSQCAATVKISSSIPDHARDMNGNLAAQMRIVGPVRGVDTLEPALTGTAAGNAATVRARARETLAFLAGADKPAPAGKDAAGKPAGEGGRPGGASARKDQAGGAPNAEQAMALLKSNACLSCHAVDGTRVGPSFHDITEKYKGNDEALGKLIKKVRDGGSGVWGAVPMPPHPNLDQADAKRMIEWILAGAPGGK